MLEKFEIIFAYILMSPIYIFLGFKKILRKLFNSKHRVLKGLLTFYLVSFLLFLFGPIVYPKQNIGIVTFYFIGYLIFFTIGYFFSVNLYNKNLKNRDKNKELKINWFIFDVALSIGIVLSSLMLIKVVGSSGISNILEQVTLGLKEPEVAYLNNLEANKEGGLVTQAATFFSPLTYIVLPLGVYFFNDMKKFRKIWFVAFILLEIMSYLSKGTNFGIFKVAVIIVSVFLLKTKKNDKSNSKNRMKRIAILIGLFTVFYFFFSITSRMDYIQVPSTLFLIPVDQNSLLFKLMPPLISLPILTGISYASQGFYGFSLAFNYNFSSTYGFGNGRFLLSLPQRIFGIDLWENTYQYKMDSVWNSRTNWHTAFTWFANDVDFFGVLIIMLILGVVFGLILLESVNEKNVFAISLLPLYMIMLIFLPLNNIVLDNPLTAVPFVVLTLTWICLKFLKRN